MKSEKQLSTFGKQKSKKVLQIFAFQKIASIIDAEAPKGSSAPITDATGPDCWTHYIFRNLIGFINSYISNISNEEQLVGLDYQYISELKKIKT